MDRPDRRAAPLFRPLWTACAALFMAGVGLGCQRSTEWNDVFQRQEGWWYSDGGGSAKLPGGKTVWLFGDTWLRRSPNLLFNSMAVQDTEPGRAPRRDEIRFFARDVNGKLLDVSEVGIHAMRSWAEPVTKAGQAYNTWLWPGAALVSGGKLIAMYAELGCTTGQFPTCRKYLGDINVEGYTLVEVENPEEEPDEWLVRATPLRDRAGRSPSASQLHWGSALLEDGGWLYIFGASFVTKWATQDVKWAPEDVKLARVVPRDVAHYDQWQFLTPDGWRMLPTGPEPRELQSIARGGTTELSVHRVVRNGQAWLLMVQLDPFAKEVVVRRAVAGELESVRWEGPEAGENVRRLSLPALDPGTEGGMSWAGRAHAHHSSDKSLLVSYFSNKAHSLRFLEIPMSELLD